jgi:hypothetical protein
MDPAQVERNNERIKRKRENEGIARKIETLVKKSHNWEESMVWTWL